jgi:hypothetical protein
MRKLQLKKNKLLVAFIFFSQVVFSHCIAQETNKVATFKGWNDLIWGCSETDVKQKYGSQLTILETAGKYGNGEYYCPFEIKNYEISIYKNFTVSFLFEEKTKKLAQVNVTMEDPTNVLNVLQELKSSLGEKYDKPQIIEETPDYNIKWYFPELDIEIKHLFIRSLDNILLNTIMISYKKHKQTEQTSLNVAKKLEKKNENLQLEIPVYRLFPTENYWTFIKLDTRNGKMWQVHFSVSKEGYQGEKDLNLRSLVLTDEEIKGRFTLVPTKNMYNFLLLDQLTGKTYQVQWNNEYLNRLVHPIL